MICPARLGTGDLARRPRLQPHCPPLRLRVVSIHVGAPAESGDAGAEKLASWVTLSPGNYMSAGKRSHGRTGKRRDLHKADARAGRLGGDQDPGPTAGQVPAAGAPVRRPEKPGRGEDGDPRHRPHSIEDCLPGAQERQAVLGPWRGLLHQPGVSRAAPAYLLRQLERLSPGCTITITPAEAA